jgi:Zn-dependent peptidase ImmA (M78 family)
MMKDLLHHAATMGISVHAARLEPGVLGEWYEDEREVYFDLRLTPHERRCVVGHELGHAHYGHRCEDDQHAETQADVYAATLLVDPVEYERLECEGLDSHEIAEELRVTAELLDVFRRHCLTSLRGVTYVRSRMGLGQWAHIGFRRAEGA